MRIHSIIVQHNDWGNTLEVEAFFPDSPASGATAQYNFLDVPEEVLTQIEEWASRETHLWGKKGYVTPIAKGWAWYDGSIAVA